MLNIEFYKTSGFFEFKNYKVGDLVFDEWSMDENLYIIVSWKVSIWKYTTNEKTEIKELAVLSVWDFFWEASFTSSIAKEALVKILEDTSLICINWKTWIQDFLQKYPKEWFELLSYIIENTNKRLVLANRIITANYEIVKSITEIENINDKSIFNLIEKIKLITDFDYVLYFELNQVMNDYIILKYDTREIGKFLDIIIERKKINNLREVNEVVLENYNYIQKLSIWKYDLGFIIFSKKTNFTYDDKKLLLSISNNLTWLLRQKIILKDELNKKSMKER